MDDSNNLIITVEQADGTSKSGSVALPGGGFAFGMIKCATEYVTDVALTDPDTDTNSSTVYGNKADLSRTEVENLYVGDSSALILNHATFAETGTTNWSSTTYKYSVSAGRLTEDNLITIANAALTIQGNISAVIRIICYSQVTSTSYAQTDNRHLQIDVTIESGQITGATRVSNSFSKLYLESSYECAFYANVLNVTLI